jgi:hypothetical protein
MKLSELRSQLRSLLITDWKGILLNPNFCQTGSTITWNNSRGLMLPERLTFKDVVTLAREGQYSFQLAEDGSLFQFYYVYDRRGRTITEARIAYYEAKGHGLSSEPTPTEPPETRSLADISDRVMPALTDRESADEFSEGKYDLPRWLRIDYRSTNAKGVLHNDCHLHFSGFPGTRLVVSGIPTPRQFVEFVLCYCYPELYRQVRLDKNGEYLNQAVITRVNKQCVILKDNTATMHMTHLRIPSTGI